MGEGGRPLGVEKCLRHGGRECEQENQWGKAVGPSQVKGWQKISPYLKHPFFPLVWLLPPLAPLLTLFPHMIATPFAHWSSQDSILSDQFQISTWFLICSLFNVLMMKAVCTFETSVHFQETIGCYIPQGCLLHTHCHENLKSHNYSQRLNIPLQKYKTNKILLTINLNMI
jgi:hypothetical protein